MSDRVYDTLLAYRYAAAREEFGLKNVQVHELTQDLTESFTAELAICMPSGTSVPAGTCQAIKAVLGLRAPGLFERNSGLQEGRFVTVEEHMLGSFIKMNNNSGGVCSTATQKLPYSDYILQNQEIYGIEKDTKKKLLEQFREIRRPED